MRTLAPRAVVSLLLAVSGLLAVAGARERWWPACRPGAFDSPGCLARQDDRFGQTSPHESWVPLGHAAELAGASYAALALATGLLAWLLLRARPGLAAAATAALAGGLLPLAAALWASGRAGEAVDVPVLLVAPGALLWPLAAVALLVVPAGSRRAARVLLATVLCLCSPLGGLVVASLLTPALTGYVSHDHTPWSEAVTGGLLVLAAVVAWPATGHGPRATSPRASVTPPGPTHASRT